MNFSLHICRVSLVLRFKRCGPSPRVTKDELYEDANSPSWDLSAAQRLSSDAACRSWPKSSPSGYPREPLTVPWFSSRTSSSGYTARTMTDPGYFGSKGGQKIETSVFRFTQCGDDCVTNAAEVAGCDATGIKLEFLCQDPTARTQALRCINSQCSQDDLYELREAMGQCPRSATTSPIHPSSATATVGSTTRPQSPISSPTDRSTHLIEPSDASETEMTSSQLASSIAPTFIPSTAALTSVLTASVESTNIPSSDSPAVRPTPHTTSGTAPITGSSHNSASGTSSTIYTSASNAYTTADPDGPPRAVVSALSTVLAVIALVVIIALAVYVRRRCVIRRSYGQHIEQEDASQVAQADPHKPSLPYRCSDAGEPEVGSSQGQDEATSAYSVRYSEYSETPLLVISTPADARGSARAEPGAARWAIDTDRTSRPGTSSAASLSRPRVAWYDPGGALDGGTMRTSVSAVTGHCGETAGSEHASRAGQEDTRSRSAGTELAAKAVGSDERDSSPAPCRTCIPGGPSPRPSASPRPLEAYNAGPSGCGRAEPRFLTVLMDLHQESAGRDDPPPYHPPVSTRSFVPMREDVPRENVENVGRAQ